MEHNIVDLVKSVFTPDVTARASRHLEEDESRTATALKAAIPTVLAGLLAKSATPEPGMLGKLMAGATEVFGGRSDYTGYFNDIYNHTSADLEDTNWLGRVGSILNSLFGDRLNNVIEAISGYTGVKASSAQHVLGAATPAVLGTLQQYAVRENLDEKGLANYLQAQKSNIITQVPPGLNLAGALGLSSLAELEYRNMGEPVADVPPADAYVPVEESSRGGSGKWVLILLLLAALAAIWYFWRGCDSMTDGEIPVEDTIRTVDNTAATGTMAAREPILVTLPDGNTLDAYRGGIEDQLVAFLSSDYQSLPEEELKNKWFDFDALNFETNQATLTPESQQQINNIAAILKAFPKAEVKIGGYTDNTGNAEYNEDLSEDRADAVKAALERAGVGEQVTDAEGYGSEFARYPAEAPETDRVKDRRISLSVRK